MSTWTVAPEDRDSEGKIKVEAPQEPRSLADLLPTPEATQRAAQTPAHKLTRAEMGGLATVALLCLFLIAFTRGNAPEPLSAPLPTAAVVPTALPTIAPTAQPTAVPTVVPTPFPTAEPPTPVVIEVPVEVPVYIYVTTVPEPTAVPRPTDPPIVITPRIVPPGPGR